MLYIAGYIALAVFSILIYIEKGVLPLWLVIVCNGFGFLCFLFMCFMIFIPEKTVRAIRAVWLFFNGLGDHMEILDDYHSNAGNIIRYCILDIMFFVGSILLTALPMLLI